MAVPILAAPDTSLLIQVQEDREPQLVPREGRLAVERGIIKYPSLLEKWKKDAGKRFIERIAKLGYEWNGGKLRFEGPLAHLHFSEDTSPDLGSVRAPDPRDVKRRLAAEKYERERLAHKMDRGSDLVDYKITGWFKVLPPRLYRTTRG